MTTPAVQLKPEAELDRTNTFECVLSNLAKCCDRECQKSVLRHFMGSIRLTMRREIRNELAQYAEQLERQAEEQREESLKLIESAQQVRAMLDSPPFRPRNEQEDS